MMTKFYYLPPLSPALLFLGFSTDQFNFQNASLGNRVFFTRDGTPPVECDVVQYSTNENQIVCRTR